MSVDKLLDKKIDTSVLKNTTMTLMVVLFRIKKVSYPDDAKDVNDRVRYKSFLMQNKL